MAPNGVHGWSCCRVHQPGKKMSGSWRYLEQEPKSAKPLPPTQLPNPLSLGTVLARPPEGVHLN